MLAESFELGGDELATSSRILAVEARYGSLRQVVQSLKGLGLACESVCGSAEAARTLETDTGLCLGVTDLANPGTLLRELRYRYPALPWVEVTRPDMGVADVAASIFERLKDHPYSGDVVEVIRQALGSQWGNYGEAQGACYLRRDGRVLDNVCAAVEVAGRGLWGRVMFTASEPTLYRQCRRVAGVDPLRCDEVHDLAAEVANRLTGVIRRHYRMLGVPSTQGAPALVVGQDMCVRPVAGTPSLVVEHRTGSGEAVHLEWHLGTKPEGSSPPPYGQLPTGEPVYL